MRGSSAVRGSPDPAPVGRKQARRLSAGEGNATQNSSLIWFGHTDSDPVALCAGLPTPHQWGDSDPVVRLDAKWPSGKGSFEESLNHASPIPMVEPD